MWAIVLHTKENVSTYSFSAHSWKPCSASGVANYERSLGCHGTNIATGGGGYLRIHFKGTAREVLQGSQTSSEPAVFLFRLWSHVEGSAKLIQYTKDRSIYK